MLAIPTLAIAIQMTMTTKLVCAVIAVVAYVGGKHYLARRRATPAPVKPTPVTPAPLVPVTNDDKSMEAWMSHWRHLIEAAMLASDPRQIELLNLIMTAKTEECLSEERVSIRCKDDAPYSF